MDAESRRIKAAMETCLECLVKLGNPLDWDCRKDAIIEVAVLLHDLRKEAEDDDD